MTISIGQIQALTTKGIDSKGGVKDSIFKNHAFLKRLKEKEGVYSGEKMTFPFNYVDDTGANGGYYVGAEGLSLDQFDPITELSFDIVELQSTLVLTHRDLARNSGKEARLKLVAERLKLLESSMRQLLTKGIFSDGTASTGALDTNQFDGLQAFLAATTVTYGGLSTSDVATHIAYNANNSGTNRAITTALHQEVLGGASEGENKPTIVICRQGVMNNFIELLKPHQRTTRDNNINGLGHDAINTLVYSGVDHIVDNLCEANSMNFLNENYVKLYAHPEYNMKRVSKADLESTDAMLERLFWKGVFACSVLRYQGKLDDITG